MELIEEAKKERQRLLAQIEQSQLTIEHSRQIIARIDEVPANTAENAALSPTLAQLGTKRYTSPQMFFSP